MENGKSVADVRAWGMWLAMKVDSSSGSLTLCKDGECSQEFCIWDSQCIEGYHCCKSNFEFTCQKIYRPEQVKTWGFRSTLKGSSDFDLSFSWPASHCRHQWHQLGSSLELEDISVTTPPVKSPLVLLQLSKHYDYDDHQLVQPDIFFDWQLSTPFTSICMCFFFFRIGISRFQVWLAEGTSMSLLLRLTLIWSDYERIVTTR